jgi:hypothetical protein
MENKIPTAEECLIKESVLLKTIEESGNFPLNLTRDTHIGSAHAIKRAMIEFAKIHVEEALKAAYDNIEYTTVDSSVPYVVEESILNSYPLTNIK